jgi:hypothetical protein
VTRVTADPQDAGTAYVTLSGYRYHDNTSHIFKTTNFGSTWTDIGFDLPPAPVNDVIVDTIRGNLYVATDVGVYYKSITATSWSVMGLNLPLVPVSDLTLHYPTGKLVAATYGRSMFSLDLNQLPSAIGEMAVSCKVNVFPNPTSDWFIVKVTGAEKEPLSLVLCDEKGSVVRKTVLNQQETRIERDGLSKGVYFFRLYGRQKIVQHGTVIIQ